MNILENIELYTLNGLGNCRVCELYLKKPAEGAEEGDEDDKRKICSQSVNSLHYPHFGADMVGWRERKTCLVQQSKCIKTQQHEIRKRSHPLETENDSLTRANVIMPYIR